MRVRKSLLSFVATLAALVWVSAVSAEETECSTDHDYCYQIALEDIAHADNLCEFRERLGITNSYDPQANTYTITINPYANGASQVPSAVLPSHEGQWETYEEFEAAVHTLLGFGCGSDFEAPRPPLCYDLEDGWGLIVETPRIIWRGSDGEVHDGLNTDPFWGVLLNPDGGSVSIPDFGDFELLVENGCQTKFSQDLDGNVFEVTQCSEIQIRKGTNIETEMCAPDGHIGGEVTFTEEPYARTWFDRFALNQEERQTIGVGGVDEYRLWRADQSSIDNNYFLSGIDKGTIPRSRTSRPPWGFGRADRDGICGDGEVRRNSDFPQIDLSTQAGNASCTSE